MRNIRQQKIQRQITRLCTYRERLVKLSNRLSWARLLYGMSGLILSVLVFQVAGTIPGWLVLSILVIGFGLLVKYHDRIELSVSKFSVMHSIKRDHLAKMQVQWEEMAPSKFIRKNESHPFELDLNITGERSLHRLIDTTVTMGGGSLLLEWLLQTDPDFKEAIHRQKAVREMVEQNIFRDRLRLEAKIDLDSEKKSWSGERLIQWLKKHEKKPALKKYLLSLSVLAIANISLFLFWLLTDFPPVWGFTFIVYFGLFIIAFRYNKSLFVEADYLQKSLESFRAVLSYLENRKFPQNSELANLCKMFHEQETRPSKYLKQIAWIAGAAANSQRSQIGWLVINALVPWDMYFTYRLEQLQVELAPRLKKWLNKWYELEALSSLANFSYLNRSTMWPDIQIEWNEQKTRLFDTEELGHPMIPEEQRVCNDFSMTDKGDIALITGSNMSGKSTFLRTIGVNLALTFAGGPVIASSFRVKPIRLFTCINISDSLNDGISYFYAEVKRLKSLLNAYFTENRYPLFFLIDEIFRGTNNRERLIGSRAVIRSLTEGNGLGVIATHDLELTGLSDELNHVTNYHFREHLADGRLEFDYHLRTGPCPTTNALKIMSMEGLPVEKS